MENFLETYILPQLTQEKIDNLKKTKPYIYKEIEFVVKTFPEIKLQVQKTVEIYYW